MKYWDQDKYIEAWRYASFAHNGQKVPGSDIPYIHHIGLVAMEAMSAAARDGHVENPDLLVLCALLHDTLEDTDSTYEEIEKKFGSEVAEGVMALTKNDDLPSKSAKMEDSLERIMAQPREVRMVKLADRITNLQPPPKHWSGKKIESYRNEARLILKKLGPANRYLAERLKRKIDEYGKFLEEEA